MHIPGLSFFIFVQELKRKSTTTENKEGKNKKNKKKKLSSEKGFCGQHLTF